MRIKELEFKTIISKQGYCYLVATYDERQFTSKSVNSGDEKQLPSAKKSVVREINKYIKESKRKAKIRRKENRKEEKARRKALRA